MNMLLLSPTHVQNLVWALGEVCRRHRGRHTGGGHGGSHGRLAGPGERHAAGGGHAAAATGRAARRSRACEADAAVARQQGGPSLACLRHVSGLFGEGKGFGRLISGCEAGIVELPDDGTGCAIVQRDAETALFYGLSRGFKMSWARTSSLSKRMAGLRNRAHSHQSRAFGFCLNSAGRHKKEHPSHGRCNLTLWEALK